MCRSGSRYLLNKKLGYDSQGEKASYIHYWQDWAEVSNTPLRLFKGTSAEGGMRVPFIMLVPGRTKPGITNEFVYATDFLPTVLDIAQIPMPGDEYHGKKLIRPTGKSLLPLLEGKQAALHPDDAIGFEGTGGQALFKGGYKLMRNDAPFGDGRWHLYDMAQDWTESRDLSAARPELVANLQAEVQRYIELNGVVLPEPGYNALLQLLKNNAPILLRQMAGILAAAFVVILGIPLALIWWLLRRRHHRRLLPAKE
jgi:hypothetical protein